MNKSTFFSGQPVLSQIVSLIPDSLIQELTVKHGSDRYYKYFKTRDHLIAMLYACFHNCTSLREVVTGIEASYNKLSHLNMQYVPRRSTLAEANAQRIVPFFEDLYHRLYAFYYGRLPDSRSKKNPDSRLFIMDSTTVSLFSDVMRGAGSYGSNGRKKGGMKAHVVLDAQLNVPKLIYLSEASRNDRIMMERVALSKGDILCFDRGYHNFMQWEQWTKQRINWVTRLIGTEHYEVLEDKLISLEDQNKGICSDQTILLGAATNTGGKKITVRLIGFYLPRDKKIYYYLTNNFRFKATTVARIYKRRWEVETFFKRIKQNNPLKSFLGDNENSIRIQMWCAFIKDLLIKIVKDQLNRKWSFSNINSMIRHHLMNYLNVFKFLNHPYNIKEAMHRNKKQSTQLAIFPT
jgi:hypothetical protein